MRPRNPVHPGDEMEADFLRANGFARARDRAVSKTLGIHGGDHVRHPPVFFDFALRQQAEVRETFAATKSIALAFLQAATQAPQPMHCAASMARSASSLGTGIALASGTPPVEVEMNPPA